MTTIPDNFQPLSVPLPPMLNEMAGVKGDSQFVALYYTCSNSSWSDGRSFATFPFYAVWQPYTEHLAIAIDLFESNLGADDVAPTHSLVCDRTGQKVYVAPFEEAMGFLDKQHPPKQKNTAERWETIKAQFHGQATLDLSQMQSLGMFELFAPNPKHKQKAIELIRWLDQYIDESLMRRYVEAASNGDPRAAWRLEMFIKRRDWQ